MEWSLISVVYSGDKAVREPATLPTPEFRGRPGKATDRHQVQHSGPVNVVSSGVPFPRKPTNPSSPEGYSTVALLGSLPRAAGYFL